MNNLPTHMVWIEKSDYFFLAMTKSQSCLLVVAITIYYTIQLETCFII